jgi:hypothetical protein
MGNGVSILADDPGDPRTSNVLKANANVIGSAETYAGDGFTVTGTVSVSNGSASRPALSQAWGTPMRAAILDEPEEPEEDVPLDEARRIAAHRHRHIEGLLGD